MFFQRVNFTHPAFWEGVRTSAALAPGLAAWGVMTGVAMVNAGMSTFDSVLMTLVVYAGSVQLAAIPLLAAKAPMWVIVTTAICVNLRFVVFSAHLRQYLMVWPRWQRLVNGYFTADLKSEIARRLQDRVMFGAEVTTLFMKDDGIAPDAIAKLFVTAAPEVRAARRHAELAARGAEHTLADVLADIRRQGLKVARLEDYLPPH